MAGSLMQFGVKQTRIHGDGRRAAARAEGHGVVSGIIVAEVTEVTQPAGRPAGVRRAVGGQSAGDRRAIGRDRTRAAVPGASRA